MQHPSSRQVRWSYRMFDSYEQILPPCLAVSGAFTRVFYLALFTNGARVGQKVSSESDSPTSTQLIQHPGTERVRVSDP